MGRADRLIAGILAASQIPSTRRRSDVSRELKAHVEDFILAARDAGHSEEETERLVFANFGDPGEIGGQFAWVYRKERAAMRLRVFALSTLAVAISIAAIIMTMQAGLAIGLGLPLLRTFSFRHITTEAADILATAAAYLGLISLEKLFHNRRFPKAAGALAVIFAIAMALSRIYGAYWRFLLFGLVIGLFLRITHVMLKNLAVRAAVVLVCFGLLGLISFGPAAMANWLAAGAGYLAMTHLAIRVDGALYRI